MTSPVSNRSKPLWRWVLSVAAILVTVGILLLTLLLNEFPALGLSSKIGLTVFKMQQLGMIVQTYENRIGAKPTSEQGLRALVEKPANLQHPEKWANFASGGDLLDGWKFPFAYHCPARNGSDEFEIVSGGPDKMMNTDDDISSVMPD